MIVIVNTSHEHLQVQHRSLTDGLTAPEPTPSTRCPPARIKPDKSFTVGVDIRLSLLPMNARLAATDVEKHDDNCPSTNDVLGKAQWAIGDINGQRKN